MVSLRDNKKRKKHRCPICNSCNIYKRNWSKVWKRKSKLKRFYDKDTLEEFEKKGKKFKCYDCKNEFDVPNEL